MFNVAACGGSVADHVAPAGVVDTVTAAVARAPLLLAKTMVNLEGVVAVLLFTKPHR